MMKKILLFAAAALLLFSSCESGDIVGGRYFGTFKNTSDNNIFASGSVDFKYGSLISWEKEIVTTIDSTQITDTIMTIDTLDAENGIYDTSYEYANHFIYDTLYEERITPKDTTPNLFLLNDLVEMINIDGKKYQGTIKNADTISMLIKTIPALNKLQLCDSSVVLDQVTKKIEINSEFKGSSVQSSFKFFINSDSESKNVEFVGYDH